MQALWRFFYSPPMMTKFSKRVYQLMRKHGDLSVDEAAAAIGRERQVVYRIEGGEQLLTAEQEEGLVKRANLSREAFVVIMCKVLSEFLDRPFIVAPKGRYLPASPLARVAELFALYEHRLEPELRERITAMLHQGRLMDAVADQTASLFEQEIRRLLADAVGPVVLEEVDDE